MLCPWKVTATPLSFTRFAIRFLRKSSARVNLFMSDSDQFLVSQVAS